MADARRLRLYKTYPSLDTTAAHVIWGEAQGRVLNDWHDLPVDFVLWRHSNDEEKAALDSIVSQLDAAAGNEVLDREFSWRDESYTRTLHTRHMRLGVRFSSDRKSVYGSDGEGWSGNAFLVIASIVGLTANDLNHGDAAFMAAEFAFSVWRAARERAAAQGYEMEIAVRTDAAAVLSVLKWILDNDSALAENLKGVRGADIKATDHGPIYVGSLRATEDQIFLVRSQGGQVSRVPYSLSGSDLDKGIQVSEEKRQVTVNEPYPRRDIVARTTEEWTDLPVEFALWKYSREEDIDFLESISRAVNEEASEDDLVESYVNRHGEPVERYRLHLSLRLMSRRCAGTAAWDIILQVLGITANVMGVTAGTFAAAKFVAMVRRKAKEKASARGYGRGFGVNTPATAALLAANWLIENDPEAARKLVASGDAYLHAADHGAYFVVSITSPDQDELFIVAAAGGGVTRIPLPSREIELNFLFGASRRNLATR